MSTRKNTEAVAMTVPCPYPYCPAKPGQYCRDFRGGATRKIHKKRIDAASVEIVHHRDGWCALPAGAVLDPDAYNDPTLCGQVVVMRGGSDHGIPDCPECLAILTAVEPAEAAT